MYICQVQSFLTALRALSHKDFHYGSYATSEQVTNVFLTSSIVRNHKLMKSSEICIPHSIFQVVAAGDLCAICQEKMHVPILLRCKHIFCEDCVSEW